MIQRSELWRLRKEVKTSQTVLAEMAGITIQWYRLLEKQRAVASRTTAERILDALNRLRQDLNLETLKLETLDLHIGTRSRCQPIRLASEANTPAQPQMQKVRLVS